MGIDEDINRNINQGRMMQSTILSVAKNETSNFAVN